MRYDYVASGLSFTRVGRVGLKEETFDFINNYVEKIQSDQHKFSMLFNAYKEKSLGERLYSRYKKSCKNIYSDSGGLQMITLGENITQEKKRMVYDVQAKNSTIAFQFDEIPVVVEGEKSEKLDVQNRFFDESFLEEKARHSGRNLKEQIDYFREIGSETKPFLILQGTF